MGRTDGGSADGGSADGGSADGGSADGGSDITSLIGSSISGVIVFISKLFSSDITISLNYNYNINNNIIIY